MEPWWPLTAEGVEQRDGRLDASDADDVPAPSAETKQQTKSSWGDCVQSIAAQ